jgi:hypothetical protein
VILDELETWTAAALIFIAVFAIIRSRHRITLARQRSIAASSTPPPERECEPECAQRARGTGGVEPVRLDLLDAESGSYSSDRNLFAYKSASTTPAATSAAATPPPDQDKDGVPDFRDNCVGWPIPISPTSIAMASEPRAKRTLRSAAASAARAAVRTNSSARWPPAEPDRHLHPRR